MFNDHFISSSLRELKHAFISFIILIFRCCAFYDQLAHNSHLPLQKNLAQTPNLIY